MSGTCPPRDPLGWGNAMTRWSRANGGSHTLLSTLFALVGRQQPWPTLPCPKSSSPSPGERHGQEDGDGAWGVSSLCGCPQSPPSRQDGASPAPLQTLALPAPPEARTTPQLHLRGPQPYDHMLAGPRALHVGVTPGQLAWPADVPSPLCSRQE